MPAHHWARDFQVDQNDIEFLTGLLLEKEQPLSTQVLARWLVDQRLEQEAAALQARFKDSRFYNPAEMYDTGQHIIFPALDYAAGVVVGERDGVNPDYEPFTVISVEFEDTDNLVRDYASNLSAPHPLSRAESDDPVAELAADNLTSDDILSATGDVIMAEMETSLADSTALVQVAGHWFLRDLLIEVNVGHLHLAEAILDINNGGPLTTQSVLEDIGGLDDGSLALQEFSLNYILNEDDRFDEVGPTGDVLWFLNRVEPQEVQHTALPLQYTPIDYDRALLDQDALALEHEIDDELSPLDTTDSLQQATATLIYAHRRVGTLPLTAQMRQIFPTAERTPRIYVTLVDGQDGEEYPGWVVHQERYIYGLDQFYRKHQLPIGAFLTARHSDEPGKIIIDFKAYRPRTEWIRLITPRNNQIAFEEDKRAVGADYDDLVILGADDLAGVDALFEITRQQRKPLATLIANVITALVHLSPQATAHAKTIYSAVNVIRRCPPGPILATLVANPDFENVGGHYWKLSDN